jgi:hypothetical protein
MIMDLAPPPRPNRASLGQILAVISRRSPFSCCYQRGRSDKAGAGDFLAVISRDLAMLPLRANLRLVCGLIPRLTAVTGVLDPPGREASMTEGTSRLGVAAQGEWQAELDKLLEREKSHTRVCDAIAAARRRSGRAGRPSAQSSLLAAGRSDRLT